MQYRRISYVRLCPGAVLPALIISQYEDGSRLLYSHGGFDVFCVYHAVPLSKIAWFPLESDDLYPFVRSHVAISRMTGGQTDFLGGFSSAGVVEYDGDGLLKKGDANQLFSFNAPKDVGYLQRIRDLAVIYGQNLIWKSFLKLYDSIPQVREVTINRKMTETVMEIVSGFPGETDLRLTLDCLMCAMVAENNRLKKYGSKFDTKLGKKVKALGVYQAIYEPWLAIRQVADYSKGKPWGQISAECEKRGILTPNL